MPEIPVSSVAAVELVAAVDGQYVGHSAAYFYIRNCSERNIVAIFASSEERGKSTDYIVHKRQELLIGPLPLEWRGNDGNINVTYSDTESIYVAAFGKRKARQEKARA